MGCSLSWFAVREKPQSTVLHELRLKESSEVKDYNLFGGNLASGWYVILTGIFGQKVMSDESIQKLSKGCEIVRGSVEDNEMVSVAEGWRNGEKIWSIIHNQEEGLQHLETEGELPPIFSKIRETLQSKQEADVDEVDWIFDVPVQVAKAITGYHPDETIPGAEFVPLSSTSWLHKTLWTVPFYFLRL